MNSSKQLAMSPEVQNLSFFISCSFKQEVQELHNQIAQSGVQVDVDAPKGQDLSQVLAEIRSKYEKMAQKNQEELKAWHETQVCDYFVF